MKTNSKDNEFPVETNDSVQVRSKLSILHRKETKAEPTGRHTQFTYPQEG